MPTSRVQVKVALDKEAHPERYCPARRCLWRTGGGWCPRHQPVMELGQAEPPQDQLKIGG